MEFKVERTQDEVDEALGRICDQKDAGGSKYPGMSYEDGFEAAIDWLSDKGIELDEIL